MIMAFFFFLLFLFLSSLISFSFSNDTFEAKDKESEIVTGAIEEEQIELDEQKSEEEITDLLLPDLLKDIQAPLALNEAVEYYINFFTTEKRGVFSRWLKRSKAYVPFMRKVLKEHGLPEDLVWLAMVESGFNPKAYSPKKAVGPWQFIKGTALRYGLKIDYWIDERRDPEKSTVAAARYLKDLFDQFDCPLLAAAGYNAGEKRIEDAIGKYKTNDFWELAKYNALPLETRAFIPKIIAAAIIAKNPERFGFEDTENDEKVDFQKVKVPGGLPLKTIAQAANIDLTELRSINPEILRGITPPNQKFYILRLPYMVNKEEFEKRLEASLKSSKIYTHLRPYRIKKKDTFASIARRYNVASSEIITINGLDGSFRLKKGSTIYLPLREDQKKPILVKYRSPKKTLLSKRVNSQEKRPQPKKNLQKKKATAKY